MNIRLKEKWRVNLTLSDSCTASVRRGHYSTLPSFFSYTESYNSNKGKTRSSLAWYSASSELAGGLKTDTQCGNIGNQWHTIVIFLCIAEWYILLNFTYGKEILVSEYTYRLRTDT
jgi:hypothetical protein